MHRPLLLAGLALWLPVVALAQDTLPSAERTAWARRAAACVACHTGDGVASAAGYVPRIAGKPEGYLYRQLLNFRDGRRHQEVMRRQLENLDDAYLRGLANHFSRLDLPYPAPAVVPSAEAVQRGRNWVLQGDAARGVPACIGCHGQALTGVASDVPGLLGLPADYLSAQLGAWRAGVRRGPAPDCMATIARALPREDIAAISRWLAAQPVPPQPTAAGPTTGPPPIPCGALAP
jgi:cytochrome c553